MSERQGRLVFVFVSKFCQLCHHVDEFFADQSQAFGHDDQIGVITNIAGGCSQMDDALCLRALLSIGIYVGHDIMAHQTLALLCYFIVDVLRMLL